MFPEKERLPSRDPSSTATPYKALPDEHFSHSPSPRSAFIAGSAGVSAEKVALFAALITLPNFVAIQYFAVGNAESIETKILKAADTIFYNFGVTYYFGADGNKRFLMLIKQWWSEKDKHCLESWLKLIGGSIAVIYLSVGASAMFIPCPQSFPVSVPWQRRLRDMYGWSNLITFAPMHLGGTMEALEILREGLNKFMHYCSAFSFSTFAIWRKKEKKAYVIKELNHLLRQVIQKYKVDPQFRELFKSKRNQLVDQLPSDEEKEFIQLRQIMLTSVGASFYKNKTYNCIKISTDVIIYDVIWLPTSLVTWFVMDYTQFGYWVGSVETNSVLGWNTVIINLFLMLMGAKIYLKLLFSYPQELLLGCVSGHLVKPFAYYSDTWRGNVILALIALLLGFGGYYSGYSAMNLINAYLYNPNGEPQLISARIYWPKLVLVGAALFNSLPNFQILFTMISNEDQVKKWLQQRISRYPDFSDVKHSAGQISCNVRGVWGFAATIWNFFSFLATDILLIIPDKICMWIFLKLFTGFCALIPKVSNQHHEFVHNVKQLDALDNWLERTCNQPSSTQKIVNTMYTLLDNNPVNEVDAPEVDTQESSIIVAAIQHGLFAELTLSPSATRKSVIAGGLASPVLLINRSPTQTDEANMGGDDIIKKVLAVKREIKSLQSDFNDAQTPVDSAKEICSYRVFVAEELLTTWTPFVVGVVLNKLKESGSLLTSPLSGACRLLWTIGSCVSKRNLPTIRQIYRDVAPGIVGFLTDRAVRLGLEQISAMENSPEVDIIASNAGIVGTTITANFLKRLP